VNKNKSILYALTAALLCLSMASVLWGNNPQTPTREVEAGQLVFSLQGEYEQEFTRRDGPTGKRVYGFMDEREICFFSYIAFTWSKNELSDSALLPASAYKVDSRSSSPITLQNRQHANLLIFKISAKKPCGRVVKENLTTITFYSKKTKTYYAVAGFIKPLLSQEQLVSIASSATINKSGKNQGQR
jgi:hypothetical protein